MGFPVSRRLREPPVAPDLLMADSLMAATHRELAILSADMMGVQSYLGQFGPGSGVNGPARGDRQWFRDLMEDPARPFLIIDPRPGLHIVDYNDAYAAVAMIARRRVVGEKLFDVFPDNPDIPDADGVSNLYESLKRCAQSGRAHRMQLQRYDIRNPTGQFVTRRWRPVNTPIFDDKGHLVFLLHHVDGAVEA